MNVPRRCCRPGCPHYAVATLTFVYSDSTAVIGPLATAREPHSWDWCVGHAGRITAPRGWELVRHAGPLPSHPDEDDLVPWRTRCARVSSAGAGTDPAEMARHRGLLIFPPGDRAPTGVAAAPPEPGAGRHGHTGVARPRRLVLPCRSRSIRPASFAGR
ncbi:DUF3499 domain-containing protein [Mycobacterium tuberculosis]